MPGLTSREKIAASAVKTLPVIGWSRVGKDDDGGAIVIAGSLPACTLFVSKDHSMEDKGGRPEGAQGAGTGVRSVSVCMSRVMGICEWFRGRMTVEGKETLSASVGSEGIKV